MKTQGYLNPAGIRQDGGKSQDHKIQSNLAMNHGYRHILQSIAKMPRGLKLPIPSFLRRKPR